jgi:glycerol kinase
MSYIGSLDQGTSSTRFMIFDHEGNVVGQHQLEHEQILAQPGWVEHDAAEIWLRTQQVITQALKNAHLVGADLKAVGITNQRETALFWDIQTGKPLGNAIVWQDTRTDAFLEGLTLPQREKIQSRTGLMIAPYFSIIQRSNLALPQGQHLREISIHGFSGNFPEAFVVASTSQM